MERAPESKRSSHSKQALSGPHSQQQTNQQSFPQPYQQQYPYQHQPQQTYPETPQMDQQMCQSRQKPQMYQQTQQQWAVNFKPCNDRFMGCSCRVAANVFAIVVLIVSAIHGGLNIYVMSKSYGNLGYYIDLALVLLQIVGSVMVVLAYFNDSSCLYISGEVVSLVHYGAVLLIGLWLCVANRFGTLLVIGVIFVPALIITLLIMLVISSVRCVKVLNAEELRLQNIGFGVPGEYASAQMYQQQSLANQQLNPSSKKHEDRCLCCPCRIAAVVLASLMLFLSAGQLGVEIYALVGLQLNAIWIGLELGFLSIATIGPLMVIAAHFWNFTCLYTASIVLNGVFVPRHLASLGYSLFGLFVDFNLMSDDYPKVVAVLFGFLLFNVLALFLSISLIIAAYRSINVVNAERIALQNGVSADVTKESGTPITQSRRNGSSIT